ncbi:uncharacterized protein LOC132754188 [Ruditapes philippinarum]|uniref:uncharacterized protein LOC132754188 n=1 Tax=Ruditapes philippinarum TaxID=129788 RepID=UPI00295A7DFA|nr:uncharacterized protein LOC132754188 [Ruditapes philippinarum]
MNIGKRFMLKKCTEIQNIEKFMQTYFSLLYTLTNDSNNIYNVKQEFEDDMSSMEESNINNIMEDLSFENLDVSRDHARADYNLTDEEINLAEEQSRNEILNSSILSDFNAIVNISRNNTDAELNNIESFNFISYWLASMDNGTDEYFPPDICWGFKDCVLHCLSSLYNLFAEEQVPDLDMIQNIIMSLDDIATNLFLNQNITLKELVSVMENFNFTVTDLMKLNPFCSTAPVFRHDVRNITAVNGSKVSFSCDAVGDPQPDVWWFKDGKIIAGEDKAYLEISNIGPEDEAAYHCVVGNVVANLSSNEAWLTVVGNIVSDSDKSNGTENYLRNVLIGLAATVFIGFGIAVLYIIQRKNRHNCITPVDTKDDDKMAAKSSECPDIFELQNKPNY